MELTSTKSSNSNQPNFQDRLLNELKEKRFNSYSYLENYDHFFRRPLPAREQPGLKGFSIFLIEEIKDLFSRGQFFSKLTSKIERFFQFLKSSITCRFFPDSYFAPVLLHCRKFESIYLSLFDRASRELLISLLAYRILGYRKVKLGRNNPAYWEGIEQSHKLDMGVPAIRIPFLTWPLLRFDLRPLGYDMQLHTYAQAVAINFVQKQYVLDRPEGVCKAELNDIVIDAGGCWGDTALQFACNVGPKGHVYTFEFVPSNLGVMYKNLELNPHLKPLITVVENPVGANAGGTMFFFENGPGSRVASTKLDDRYIECKIQTIDKLVEEKNVPRVDFIKMDVEGSEMDALKGSETTIRKFRPKLAICIYHKPDDYIDIPKYLADLNLGYRFFVDHHTIYLNETVLFAVPESRT